MTSTSPLKTTLDVLKLPELAHASNDDLSVLVSMKWQETSGTAEQNVPFEMLWLGDAVREDGDKAAYPVLSGPG